MDKTCKARNIIWRNTCSVGIGRVFAFAFGIFGNGRHAVSMFVEDDFVQGAVHCKGFPDNIPYEYSFQFELTLYGQENLFWIGLAMNATVLGKLSNNLVVVIVTMLEIRNSDN